MNQTWKEPGSLSDCTEQGHPIDLMAQDKALHERGIKINFWISLVAQWLRICLPVQGIWVRALVQEDPTCCGATKPVSHNY